MIDFSAIFEQTVSGILINLPWFILIIWATRTIAKEAPRWLKQYHDNQIKEIMLTRAVSKK
jgi:hypothetical protein